MQGRADRMHGWSAGGAWRWARIVGAGVVMACLFVLVACGNSATPTASGAQQESVTVTSRTAAASVTRQPTATTAARTATPARATPSAAASASATRSGTAAKTGAVGAPAPGPYDCYSTADAFSTRYQTSFTLNANGTYSIDDGTGKYTYDAANARVLFTSGPYADGGFFGDYDPTGTPTIYLKDQATEGPGFSCQRG